MHISTSGGTCPHWRNIYMHVPPLVCTFPLVWTWGMLWRTFLLVPPLHNALEDFPYDFKFQPLGFYFYFFILLLFLCLCFFFFNSFPFVISLFFVPFYLLSHFLLFPVFTTIFFFLLSHLPLVPNQNNATQDLLASVTNNYLIKISILMSLVKYYWDLWVFSFFFFNLWTF